MGPRARGRRFFIIVLVLFGIAPLVCGLAFSAGSDRRLSGSLMPDLSLLGTSPPSA
ncbi:MAG: hypothetical protein ACXVHX_32525 [Solirubrobacteraceae bacterium]